MSLLLKLKTAKSLDDIASLLGYQPQGLAYNVLKLHRCLRKTDRTQPRQMVFCDPGVDPLAETRKHHRAPVNRPLTNAA
ncbi:hypothetical protein [Bradyrhizobium sp. USDA 4486]